jgi:endogenous inhibitor of DNA gyrase (YacG/DUF329 family)
MDDRFRPFCSSRCKMADLGRWLNGDFRVAGRPASGAPQDDALDPSDEIVEDDSGQGR